MQRKIQSGRKNHPLRKRSGRTRISILIVEDSPTQAEHLRHVLRQQKYQVSIAGNGKEALVKMQSERYDIAISDVLMPEMDGYEFCRQVKSNPKLKDIPVILLTSLSDPKDVLKGLECGANSFIVKPYEPGYLLSRIQYVLANEEIRRKESFRVGIEIFFAGQRYFIASDRVQILDLLLSTYESAVLRNTELAQVQEELRKLNESLEIKVRERTEAVRKSEEQYRLLFESNPLPMWVYDGQMLSILAVNDAAVEHYGYSRDEFLSMTIKELRPPEDVPRLLDLVSSPGHQFRKAGIWRHRRKNGSIIEVEIISHDIVWQGRQARFVLANDITERKQAEALQSALYRIAEKTSSAEDMQEFYAAIHSIVGELMYAKNFYIALYDDSKQKVHFPYYVDEVDACEHPDQSIGGLTGRVLRTGQALLVSQETFDEMVDRGEIELIGEPSHYWLGVPLKAGERTFGVLAVQSYSENITFGEKEEELLTFVS
ncbi:MAG TPA: response regulator, partial [Acidobacteriota bacterium]|nr:response regulator [Acidobacteriota bacterium]